MTFSPVERVRLGTETGQQQVNETAMEEANRFRSAGQGSSALRHNVMVTVVNAR